MSADRPPEHVPRIPPSVLWDDEATPFLGRLLLIFEKVLTGVADGSELRVDVAVDGTRRGRVALPGTPDPPGLASSQRYDAIEPVIDGLHHLLDPRADPDRVPALPGELGRLRPRPAPRGRPGSRERSPRLGGPDPLPVFANRPDRPVERPEARPAPVDRRLHLEPVPPRVTLDDGESLLRIRPPGGPDEPSAVTAVSFASAWPYLDRSPPSRRRPARGSGCSPRSGHGRRHRRHRRALLRRPADGGPSIDPATVPRPRRPRATPRSRTLWRSTASARPSGTSRPTASPSTGRRPRRRPRVPRPPERRRLRPAVHPETHRFPRPAPATAQAPRRDGGRPGPASRPRPGERQRRPTRHLRRSAPARPCRRAAPLQVRPARHPGQVPCRRHTPGHGLRHGPEDPLRRRDRHRRILT